MVICPECGTECADDAKFCPTCGSSLIAAKQDSNEDPFIGKKIKGNFLIESKLGEGGMGVVYKATQLSLDKPVAVKVLHKHLFSADKSIALRFQREAKSASKIEHPNCINIIDFGQIEDEGSLFIAMEFIHGRPLTDIIQEEFPLERKRIAKILAQVCSVLAEAHSKGIVHRDMKPDNIMIIDRPEEPDFVKVLDFGIAKLMDRQGPKLTMDGMVCGTPEYMAPEQAMGKDLDARADIYAVGCILYEMLTQHVPFEDDSYQVILTSHVRDMPMTPSQRRPDLQIDPELEAICMKALQKDPAARFQDCVEMKHAFEAVLEHDKPQTASASAPPAAPKGGTAMWTAGSTPPGMAAPGSVATGAATPSQQPPQTPNATMAMQTPQPSSPPPQPQTPPAPTMAATPQAPQPTQPEPQQTLTQQPAMTQPNQQTIQGTMVSQPGAQATPNVTVVIPQKSNTGLIIGIVAALIIIGGGIGAYFAFSGKSEPNATKPKTNNAAVVAKQTPHAAVNTNQPPEPKPTAEKPDPKRAEQLFKEAKRLNSSGKREQAVKYLKMAVFHNPKMSKAYKLLGDLQVLQNNMPAAKEAYKKYLELEPNAPDKQFVQEFLKQ